VLDSDEALIDRSDLAQVQFAHQTSFGDAFHQTRSLQAVNLYGRANDKVAQLISFLEKCVRASGVHQGNEEELCPAVQPSIFDMLAGESPASAMDGWAE
jgi:hypothetical protein